MLPLRQHGPGHTSGLLVGKRREYAGEASGGVGKSARIQRAESCVARAVVALAGVIAAAPAVAKYPYSYFIDEGKQYVQYGSSEERIDTDKSSNKPSGHSLTALLFVTKPAHVHPARKNPANL